MRVRWGLIMFLTWLYLFLTLAACSSVQKRQYACACFHVHGVFARWTGYYDTERDAREDAEKIADNLKAKNLIPENSGVFCALTGE